MIYVAKNVALIIAEKVFRDEEYLVPKKILESAGVNVITASTTTGQAVGKLGVVVKPDRLIAELEPLALDAVIFVGGGGSSQYFNDGTAHHLANHFYQGGKIVGAICIAPVILANAGLLRGKRATVFPDGQPELAAGGALYTGNPVEIDGRLITGNGPEAAELFGRELLKMLES